MSKFVNTNDHVNIKELKRFRKGKKMTKGEMKEMLKYIGEPTINDWDRLIREIPLGASLYRKVKNGKKKLI